MIVFILCTNCLSSRTIINVDFLVLWKICPTSILLIAITAWEFNFLVCCPFVSGKISFLLDGCIARKDIWLLHVLPLCVEQDLLLMFLDGSINNKRVLLLHKLLFCVARCDFKVAQYVIIDNDENFFTDASAQFLQDICSFNTPGSLQNYNLIIDPQLFFYVSCLEIRRDAIFWGRGDVNFQRIDGRYFKLEIMTFLILQTHVINLFVIYIFKALR